MLGLAPAKKGADGGIQINLNMDSPKDEGDYMMYDLLLGTLGVTDKDKDKNKKPRTDAEKFQDSLSTLIALLSEDTKLKKTFVGEQYVPFLVDLKAAGHLETLANLVQFQSGTNEEAGKWVLANVSKVTAMNKWAKDYQPDNK